MVEHRTAGPDRTETSGDGRYPQPQASTAAVALASEVTPNLRLEAGAADRLRSAAARQDVWLGGCFAAGPKGAEVWNAPRSTPGALLLGSVTWMTTLDCGLVITSVSVSPAGLAHGEGTLTILARVLALAGLPVDGSRVTIAVPQQPSHTSARDDRHAPPGAAPRQNRRPAAGPSTCAHPDCA